MQMFPNSFPAREYVSQGVARSLQLPYTVKEAWEKYRRLANSCKKEWKIENKEHAEQLKICTSLLELGKPH